MGVSWNTNWKFIEMLPMIGVVGGLDGGNGVASLRYGIDWTVYFPWAEYDGSFTHDGAIATRFEQSISTSFAGPLGIRVTHMLDKYRKSGEGFSRIVFISLIIKGW